jgi:hypothetical protein
MRADRRCSIFTTLQQCKERGQEHIATHFATCRNHAGCQAYCISGQSTHARNVYKYAHLDILICFLLEILVFHD